MLQIMFIVRQLRLQEQDVWLLWMQNVIWLQKNKEKFQVFFVSGFKFSISVNTRLKNQKSQSVRLGLFFLLSNNLKQVKPETLNDYFIFLNNLASSLKRVNSICGFPKSEISALSPIANEIDVSARILPV